MKFDLKKLFVKYFLLAFVLEILMILAYYVKYNEITEFKTAHITIYFLLILGLFIFWALLDYFQNITGMLMKESWTSRIIFLLVALALFYLYKINGRI